MAMIINYYDMLGVESTADPVQIVSAWNRLSKELPNDDRVKEKASLVNQAFEIPSNSAKRKKFDQMLERQRRDFSLPGNCDRNETTAEGRAFSRHSYRSSGCRKEDPAGCNQHRLVLLGMALVLFASIGLVCTSSDLDPLRIFREPARVVKLEGDRDKKKVNEIYRGVSKHFSTDNETASPVSRLAKTTAEERTANTALPVTNVTLNETVDPETSPPASPAVSFPLDSELATEDAVPIENVAVVALPVSFVVQEKEERAELPSRADIDLAKKKIGELFRERYENAQKQMKIEKLVQMRNLSQDILDIKKSDTLPEESFAIYEVAIDLAKKSCFAAEALRTVEAFEKEFPIDGHSIRLEMFAYWKTRLPQTARNYADRKMAFLNLATEIEPYLMLAIKQKKWSIGLKLSELATSFCSLGGDKVTAAKFDSVAARMGRFVELESAARKGLEELKTNQWSAKANQNVGIYYCFALEDWKRGLVFLKDSEDPKLASFAATDLIGIDDVESSERAGDQWWSLMTEPEYKLYKLPLAKRAKSIYQSCIDRVSSLSAARMKKRIDEANSFDELPMSKIPHRQVSKSTGMPFVLIKPGTFKMGNKRFSDAPINTVTLTEPFYIGVYEVTQSEWNKVMGIRPWTDQKYVKVGDRIPATWMNWSEAIEFCLRLSKQDKRSYRLPTEAEWEYACRAGSSGEYCFGNTASQLGNYAWYKKNAVDVGEAYPHQIGRKLPNKWGVYDMHGNVFEWTRDYYLKDYYRKSGRTNPVNLKTTKERTLRGGYFGYTPEKCVAGFRGHQGLNFRWYTVGIRLVMEVNEPSSNSLE